jgi:hypothetical protein
MLNPSIEGVLRATQKSKTATETESPLRNKIVAGAGLEPATFGL